MIMQLDNSQCTCMYLLFASRIFGDSLLFISLHHKSEWSTTVVLVIKNICVALPQLFMHAENLGMGIGLQGDDATLMIMLFNIPHLVSVL